MCEVEIKQTRTGPISRNQKTNKFEREFGPVVEDYERSHRREWKKNKFYSVERMPRHLYSFNSCILYTWVSLEALNNLYKLPLHTPNSQSLWVDL